MQYIISFLEGVITFVSPCLLPMLPIYISYFAGGEAHGTVGTLTNALGFVLGFTAIFVAMGALAGSIGSFLIAHQTAVNVISGLVVIFFGLNYLGVISVNLFHGSNNAVKNNLGFFSSVMFGVIFSIGRTPCVGAFLGSALMLASQQGQMVTGMLMLLCYSLGLGIPFLLSAVLIEQMKGTIAFMKRHYQTINMVSGGLLVLLGVLMATGMMGHLLRLLG